MHRNYTTGNMNGRAIQLGISSIELSSSMHSSSGN